MSRGQEVETQESQHAPDQVAPTSEGAAPGAPDDGGARRPKPDDAAAPPRPGAEGGDEVSVLELVNVLLKRWKLVVGLPMGLAVVTAAISLIMAEKFTARASFVPEAESQGVSLPSGLAGLASQFGVTVPGGGSTSPAFYADLLRSRTIRDQLLQARFAIPWTPVPDDSAMLLDVLEIEDETMSGRLDAGRRWLDGATVVQVDNETSIVDVTVETEHRRLSADIANVYVALLNRFNLETRQSTAEARRRFVEGRLREAEDELRAAEEDLQRFLENNRLFQNSPHLTVRHDRLEREVSRKQEVVTTLSRQYEEARIQEVNDTPVITVVDAAVPPERKSSPKRRLMVIVAGLLGGVVAVFAAFGAELTERMRATEPREFEELNTHWAALKADLRSIWRRLLRRDS